jgi:hypothetical protein
VKNVCNDDDTGYLLLRLLPYGLVYCSDKRNNVNILFEHAHSAPFELTRIVVKVMPIAALLMSTDPLNWILFTGPRRASIHLHVTYPV